MGSLRIRSGLTVWAPPIKSDKTRDIIEDGDILICAGESPLSKTISEITDSDVTHVGFLYHGIGGVFVIEAQNSVREVPLSIYRGYKGRLFIGRPVIAVDSLSVIRLAKSVLGREYDYDDLVKIALNRSWIGKLFPIRKDGDRSMYCSDTICHVYREYYASGLPVPEIIKPLLSPNYYSLPKDIAEICDIQCEVV